ncbi:hypothetical protein Tco_1136777, partial [Tanacetum coccineum]
VPEVYMHQFWDFVYKHDTFYRFKIDKRKRFKLTLEVFKDIFKICPRMHQPWRTFAALINRILSGKKTEMKKTKAYKTYLGFAIGATPPKKALKFKMPASPKLTIAPARGVVIRETPEIHVSKKKEKKDVARGKGIKVLSDVALKEDAQFKEVRRKRTGVKSGVLDVTEEESSESEAESWGNDDDDNNNDQDSRSEENSKHETDDNESGSEFNQEEDDEKIEDDEEEEEEEIVKTPSNNSDDEDETKIADKAEGEEDKEMDYTTSLLYDDVDIRMNEQVDADKGFVQEEDTDVTMTNIKQRE